MPGGYQRQTRTNEIPVHGRELYLERESVHPHLVAAMKRPQKAWYTAPYPMVNKAQTPVSNSDTNPPLTLCIFLIPIIEMPAQGRCMRFSHPRKARPGLDCKIARKTPFPSTPFFLISIQPFSNPHYAGGRYAVPYSHR